MAQSLNDGKWASNTFTGFTLMGQAEYAQFITRHLYGGEQDFVLTKEATGSFVYQPGSRGQVSLWLNDHTTPFTGEASAVYEVYCRGGSIWCSTSTGVTVSSITLRGCLCDYRAALADCKGFIADNRLLLFAQSFSDGSMTPEQALAYLRADEVRTRGAYGI